MEYGKRPPNDQQRDNRQQTGIEREHWWVSHLEERRRLGWSRARYSREYGVSRHALAYWERKLLKRLKPAPGEAPVRFLPVGIAEAARHPAARQGSGIRLRVGPVRLEVRAGFDPAVMRQLVQALWGL